MGQAEVFEWFKNKYVSGVTDFFEISEVYKDLETNNVSIRRCVIRLYAFGFLDIKLSIGKPARYRIKGSCV